jgi:hypothetical protein
MWEDLIVAEVYRTREELAAAFNFDVKAIFADLRRRQTVLGARFVRPKEQRIQTLQPTGAAKAQKGSFESEPVADGLRD